MQAYKHTHIHQIPTRNANSAQHGVEYSLNTIFSTHTHTQKISSFTPSTEDHKHVEEQAAKLSLFTSVKKICNSKWRLMAKELEHHLSNYANKIPRQNYLGSAHGISQRRVLKSLATSDSDPALTWQSFITHMTAEYSQPSPLTSM